jgi:hypothetical protein
MRSTIIITTGLAVAALAAGCGSDYANGSSAATSDGLPQGSEKVNLNPADFTTTTTNPYWPMAPGNKWIYRATEPDGTKQRVVVTVTNKTKKIADGVVARVIHDRVTEKGRLVEDTYDWYAQDKAGNVWYFGEDVKNYKNGKLTSRHGSWQAGVRGAQPGVVMPATPKVGMTYRQEYYKGEAEDAADVLAIDQKVEVPFGFFRNALMTRDYSPLEPKLVELKFYVKGTGPVLDVTVAGGAEREELIKFVKGRK